MSTHMGELSTRHHGDSSTDYPTRKGANLGPGLSVWPEPTDKIKDFAIYPKQIGSGIFSIGILPEIHGGHPDRDYVCSLVMHQDEKFIQMHLLLPELRELCDMFRVIHSYIKDAQ